MALQILPALQNPAKALSDLLIRRGLIKRDFKAILSGKDLPEFDRYLLNKKLVSDEQLSQAYAEFYRLPFIRLVNRPIAPAVARLLPEDVARRYVVALYDLKGPNLYLAIGEPARLQQNAPAVLINLRQQKGLQVHLAISPRADVEAVLDKLHDLSHPRPSPKTEVEPKPSPAAPSPAKPVVAPSAQAKPAPKELVKQIESRIKPVELSNQEIPVELLRKIPLAVAERYKILVFGSAPARSQFEPPLIKIAAVNPDDPHVREIINYIESRNKVLVERYTTDERSFNDALKRYRQIEGPTKAETPSPLAPSEPLPVAPTVMPKVIPKAEVKPPAATPKPDELPTSQPNSAVSAVPNPALGKEPIKIPGVSEGLALSSDDIISRPSTEESPEELQRLASEQQSSLENQNLDKLIREPVTTVETLAKVFRSGIIPEIVAGTLFLAIRMKASDVHIEAQENIVRLRFRIDGILHDIIRVPIFLHAPLASRIKILSKMKIDEQRIPQDGRFDVIIDNRQVDLRVSTMPTVHGEKIVMRLLDKSAGVLTLEQLGVTGSNFDTLVANINKPYGIILATGPTGSGKSTTLYAVLSRISKPGVNIITLEDPVEYELPGINQAQVKPQIGFTFAEGLRSVLRQDPNIIMVGEIRDLETAAMATHAALTGHLVLSTLHTNDSTGALPRLINMGVEPFLITSSVNAVIGQRLVRKICDNCRQKSAIPPAILNYIKKELAAIPSTQLKNVNLEQLVFYKGGSCSNCTNGYSGRIGIFEVLPMTDQIEDLAVRKAPASELKKAAVAGGMITMTQDGLIKALKGITTVDEVMRVTTTEIKEVPAL